MKGCRESSRSIARFSRLSRLSEAGVRPFAVGFVDPRWTALSTARVGCPLPARDQREQNDNAEDRCDGSRAAAADKLSASRSRGRARRRPQGGQVALRHAVRPLLALDLADVEGVWGGQDVAVDVGDEEHSPRTGLGEQDSDFQPAGCVRAAGDSAGAERGGAVDRAGAADVGVEVVKRALVEEDRVRERTTPGREGRLVPVWVEHVQGEEVRLDRVQMRRALDLEAVSVDESGWR